VLEDPVIQVPSRARFGLGHFLKGVADMDHYDIAGADRLILHHEKTDRPLHPAGLASCGQTVHLNHPHWYG